MTVLERFKMEIGKEYFEDSVYTLYLDENGLNGNDQYVKSTMHRQLLMTLLDCLNVLSNDIDLYRKTETEFSTTTEAYTNLSKRKNEVEKQINSLSTPNSVVSYLFYG